MKQRNILVYVASLCAISLSSTIIDTDIGDDDSCDSLNLNNTNYKVRHHSGFCYLFVMEEHSVLDSINFCRSMGGFLTDLDNNFKDFLKGLAKNNKDYSKKYTVGYIYFPSLGKWYWDTGWKMDNNGVRNKDGWWIFSDDTHCSYVEEPNFQFKSKKCKDKNAFICKLAASRRVDSKAPNCTQVCNDVLTKAKVAVTTLPTTTPQPDVSDPTAAESGSTQTTTIGDSRRLQKGKEDPYSHDSTTIIILAILLALSLVGILILGTLLLWRHCRYHQPRGVKSNNAHGPVRDPADTVELVEVDVDLDVYSEPQPNSPQTTSARPDLTIGCNDYSEADALYRNSGNGVIGNQAASDADIYITPSDVDGDGYQVHSNERGDGANVQSNERGDGANVQSNHSDGGDCCYYSSVCQDPPANGVKGDSEVRAQMPKAGSRDQQGNDTSVKGDQQSEATDESASDTYYSSFSRNDAASRQSPANIYGMESASQVVGGEIITHSSLQKEDTGSLAHTLEASTDTYYSSFARSEDRPPPAHIYGMEGASSVIDV